MKTRYVIFFLLGIIIGMLVATTILDYKIAKLSTLPLTTPTVDEDITIDPAKLISIHTRQDAEKLRSSLIEFIWQGESFPAGLPQTIEKNYLDPRYESGRIDRLTIVMDYGLQSIAYLFHPENWNDRLIIFHQGHDGDFSLSKDTIDFLIENHFMVMAFSMPLLGMNNHPTVEIPKLGLLKITIHDQLKFLNKPFSYFLEPVAIGLNYVEQEFHPKMVAMIGISGGGWTTTLYAAIDPRVTYSYPVAGSLPIGLRYPYNGDWGDWEQTEPSLYSIANYYELYILGSSNGRQLQILNQFDPCCFGGERGTSYEKAVSEISSSLGGEFSVFIDASQKEHSISPSARLLILDDLDKLNSYR